MHYRPEPHFKWPCSDTCRDIVAQTSVNRRTARSSNGSRVLEQFCKTGFLQARLGQDEASKGRLRSSWFVGSSPISDCGGNLNGLPTFHLAALSTLDHNAPGSHTRLPPHQQHQRRRRPPSTTTTTKTTTTDRQHQPTNRPTDRPTN